jgi:hypothetical protein
MGIYSFVKVPTDFLNHFWIQVAVSLLKPPHGRLMELQIAPWRGGREKE